MFLLNVHANDWVTAKNFFSLNPTATKMSKKVSGCIHSFIKVKDRIVAVGYKLGAGTFGVVKIAEGEDGKDYAIKAEGGKITTTDLEEETILALMNYSYGMVERQLSTAKTFIPNNPGMTFQSKFKKYKLVELLEGTDLIFELYDKDAYEKKDSYVAINNLNQEQKLIIAIKFCQILKQLQNLRIVHADIKPENIKVKIEGGIITVKIMDFGFSLLLPLGTNTKVDIYKGTGPYMAPEIYDTKSPRTSKLTYSFESDIYATGVMFLWNFGLSDKICRGMLKNNPQERDSVETIIKNLMEELQNIPGLSTDAQRFIDQMNLTKANANAPTTITPMAKLVVGKPIPVVPPVMPVTSPLTDTPPTALKVGGLGLPKIMLADVQKIQLKPTVAKPKDEQNTPNNTEASPVLMFKLRPVQGQIRNTKQPEAQKPTEERLTARKPTPPKALTPKEEIAPRKLTADTAKQPARKETSPPRRPLPQPNHRHLPQPNRRPLPQPQKPTITQEQQQRPEGQQQTPEVQPKLTIEMKRRTLQRPLDPISIPKPVSPKKGVDSPQIDFATIKPSQTKLNRIAMLKQRLAQAAPLEKLTTPMMPQPSPIIAVGYEAQKTSPPRERLSKYGIATPLLIGQPLVPIVKI